MGTVQIKQKGSENQPTSIMKKIKVSLNVDVDLPILPKLKQLINWSFSQIRQAFEIFQRISQSPMVDSFLFNKIMPFGRRNAEIIFYQLSRGERYMSVYEIFGMLIVTSFQTYRKKFQLMYIFFDLDQSAMLHGRELLLIFESIVYGYCRFTGHQFPHYSTISKYSHSNFFPGEDADFFLRQVNLRRLIDQYEGNKQVFHLFNRFQQETYKEIKEDFSVFTKSGLRKYQRFQIEQIYRILYKIYSKNDYEEVLMIQSNRQFRRQNRRDSHYRKIVQSRQQLLTPMKKISASQPKLNKYASVSNEASFKIRKLEHSQKKLSGIESSPGKKPQKLLFLKGKTYSKKEIFDTISYFRTLSEHENTIKVKEFMKKYDKKLFLKKQLTSIFKFLDTDKKGEITLTGFFKSFYPGATKDDIKVLKNWFNLYQEFYEADSLARNQPKPIVMSDARLLPLDTLDRLKQIFRAMDTGMKGFLNFQDLRKAYRVGFTADEIEGMIKQYGDGRKIELRGLCKMLLPVGWEIEGLDIETL